MRAFPVIIALTLAAGSAVATPFDGLYRPAGSAGKSWNCRDIGMDGGALAIQGKTFYGVENACQLTKPDKVRGMDAILYNAQCSGEGETYTYRLMIMRNADTGGLYIIQDGYVAEWAPCP